ncbi:hypothetical protein BDD12DRAFT_852232 [Trichophaea hybrida]|nr:hypothetical protein BDD12DRAFT_852232 [Trichophaea hybrida]
MLSPFSHNFEVSTPQIKVLAFTNPSLLLTSKTTKCHRKLTPIDHLPRIQSLIRPPLQIPYLSECRPKCDSDFDGFPPRCGVKIEELKQGNFNGRTINNMILFLQEWLFFGLLREIFKPARVDLCASILSVRATLASSW